MSVTRGHRDGVVAGAAGQLADLDAGRGDGLGEPRDERRACTAWRRARRSATSCAVTPRRAPIASASRAQGGDRALADGVVLVADVERRLDAARDHVARRRAGRRSRRRSRRARARRAPTRSAASTNSAAAASASRRRPIGVVPAWPAWPSKVRLKRVWPAIAVTTPSGRPAASSTGPCSMWTSKYARGAGRTAARRASPPIASRERDAVGVAQRQLAGVERADERAAAEERALEAQALLVGERDELERHVASSASTTASPTSTPRMPS